MRPVFSVTKKFFIMEGELGSIRMLIEDRARRRLFLRGVGTMEEKILEKIWKTKADGRTGVASEYGGARMRLLEERMEDGGQLGGNKKKKLSPSSESYYTATLY